MALKIQPVLDARIAEPSGLLPGQKLRHPFRHGHDDLCSTLTGFSMLPKCWFRQSVETGCHVTDR